MSGVKTQQKSVLVAGGAGFIGSHLCDLLLAQGFRVTVVDNLITGRKQNLQTALSQGAEFLERDINDPQALQGLEFDQIYNLASPASPVDFSRLPVFIMNTASQGHAHLLELARATKARILFASTSEVYGDPAVHPQREDYFGNVNPIGPRSCYDEAKRYGEALSFSYHRAYGVDIRVARIFNTYGPRMRPDDGRIIPNFFMQALQGQALSVYGNGSQTRSFCYVSDLALGLMKLMQGSITGPVNIGNPRENTVLEIALIVNQLIGNKTPVRHLPLPENDPKQRRPDISRAEESLAWRPSVSLEEGLQQTLAFFRQELASRPEGVITPTLG